MNEENNLNTQITTETAPKVETPVVEQPTPVTETPVAETQSTETPVAPVTETPVVEQPTPVVQPTEQQPVPTEQPNIQPQPTPNPNMVPDNNITPAKKNGHNLIVVVIIAVIVAALIFVVVTFALPKDKDNEKKDDTQQEEDKKDENKKDENDEDKQDSSYIEGDWTSMKFHFDGHTYTLTSSVQELINNGWDFDPDYLKESNSLESMRKTYTTIPLLNSKYSDSDVRVALINKTSETKKFSECTFWNINISNDWIDTPVEFSLPGGIKNGSTLAEIEQVYGKPDEDSIYRSESLKYYTYTYEKGDVLLELTIYDDKGLTEFNFKYYG